MATPIAILLSGRGSNFLALHEAIERGELPAEIVLVASNVAGAAGLDKARRLGLKTVCRPHREASSRAEHDRQMVAALREAGAEWVCLAGYMRRLGGEFVRAFPRRILNIHPSLLPAFPGLDVHRQALDYGVRVSGCTVHLVDEALDNGPIVVQRAVPVADGDGEEELAARILEQEHEAYPEALRRLLTENWRLEGRRVVFGAG
jgi:phosphoribosylglycinamide formyltransferase-1